MSGYGYGGGAYGGGGGAGPTNAAPAGSYAARSAQAHSDHGATTNNSNNYNNNTAQPANNYSTAGGANAYAAAASSASQTLTTNNQQYQQPPPSNATNAANATKPSSHHHHATHHESPAEQAEQSRLLTDATRKVQEHAYYMRQGMDADDLPVVLDRAVMMLGELGDYNHHGHHGHGGHAAGGGGAPGHHGHGHHGGGGAPQLNPKNYYELHMRCLDEMPNLEEYLLGLAHQGQQANLQQQQAQQNQQWGQYGQEIAPANLQQPTHPHQPRHTARQLYEASQYTPRAVPRLYLQICAGSALIRSNEVGAKTVLEDLIEAVKCVQCPIRGLFLRHYLLSATRDKLPDYPDLVQKVVEEGGEVAVEELEGAEADESKENEGDDEESEAKALAEMMQKNENDHHDENDSRLITGTVSDATTFVLSNFIEMTKLWVRIQHMPSDRSGGGGGGSGGKHNKEQRRRRERERNELRLLVGTNLVRLSQLDNVTPEMYGTIILPQILDQITACRDPLAQAYLMDCIIQVFPDEFHIQTLEVFLGVCPKLREKVNIRTIVQSMMERLANYYADASLLEGEDDDGIKGAVSVDSFHMFDKCINRIFEARGTAMPPKEVIRLETALLNFSLKCYPGRMDHISRCLGVCARSLRGEEAAAANNSTADAGGGGMPGDRGALVTGGGGGGVKFDAAATAPRRLDDVAVDELEKLLSIPLDSLALKVLELEHYSDLLTFLPWDNRRQVAVVMLKAVESSGTTLTDVSQIEEMFSIVTPLIQDEPNAGAGGGGMGGDGGAVSRTADLMGALGVGGGGGDSFGVDGGGGGVGGADPALTSTFLEEQVLVSKLVHLLNHDDADVAYEMLTVARRHLSAGGRKRVGHTLGAVSFAGLKLLDRVRSAEYRMGMMPEDAPPPVPEVSIGTGTGDNKEEGGEGGEDGEDGVKDVAAALAEKAPVGQDAAAQASKTTCRKLFVFLQRTVAMLAPSDPELGFKLYLQIACSADLCALAARQHRTGEEGPEFSAIAYEIMAQAFLLYEDEVSDSKAQQRSIVAMVGTLLACKTFVRDDYEALITKTAQYAAKLLKKADQCKMVTLCSNLFYTGTDEEEDDPNAFRNPQRVLECLQRGLKIADACCMASPSHVQLFVDILDYYVFFFERKCPAVSDKFVTGLVALIKEHMENIGAATTDSAAVAEARAHFQQTVRYIKQKKVDSDTAERFAPIQV